jgi:hypothetical protein
MLDFKVIKGCHQDEELTKSIELFGYMLVMDDEGLWQSFVIRLQNMAIKFYGFFKMVVT